MQTEFPRGVISTQQTGGLAASSPQDCADAAFDAGVEAQDESDEEELINLRYDQFVAQAELDHLMDDL